MKPVLVDNCNTFDHAKSICTKCGRSLPDVCLEFEQMKHKADEYDRISVVPSVPTDADTDPVPPVKTRGRPRKTDAKNAAD